MTFSRATEILMTDQDVKYIRRGSWADEGKYVQMRGEDLILVREPVSNIYTPTVTDCTADDWLTQF